MKNLVKTGWLVASALVLFAACEKEEGLQDKSVEGTYTGTLAGEGTKSASAFAESLVAATAEVTITGENEIRVHCFSNGFDSTFTLNYYEHYDSAYVCFSGERFEEMYGHMLGSGHMMGGMMGDIGNGETEWTHHMDDEHDEDDEHFGGFDINDHTFS